MHKLLVTMVNNIGILIVAQINLGIEKSVLLCLEGMYLKWLHELQVNISADSLIDKISVTVDLLIRFPQQHLELFGLF